MLLPVLSCRKIYHTLRHLERILADNSIGEHVILGRVDQLVGHNGLCECAFITVVCGQQIGRFCMSSEDVCEWGLRELSMASLYLGSI